MAGNERYDVVILGAGPGGYVAALRARKHGLRVAVVEKGRLGGVCANQGCIPTKALLRSAEVYTQAREAASFGVSAGEVGFDIGAIASRAQKVAGRMEKGVEALLGGASIPVLRGTARLAGPGRVAVAGEQGETVVEAAHVVLATGARARLPEGIHGDGRLVWTYRDALVPTSMPRSLLVMGAGAIGVEFASFFRMLGAEVVLAEAQPRILPMEDAEIGEAMRRAMKKRGVRVLTGARVASLAAGESDVTVCLESGDAAAPTREERVFDRVLVATGIAPNVEGLGLEGTAVAYERGHVVVDEWLRTGEPGLYAIGDLTGGPWLAHKANREALVCIDHIAGVAGARPLRRERIPACTYASPQVASVGLTEEAARARGFDVRVGRATFVGNGKARAIGETDGFVKTVFDRATGALLGAHLLGPEVTELIAMLAMALTMEATEAELLETIFPHPTLSEAVQESVEAAFAEPTPRPVA